MFNERVNAQRETWVYKYTGHQLLRAVKVKLEYLNTVSEALHNELTYMLKHAPRDEVNLKDLREKSQRYSKELEQCAIYHHEFSRNPGIEYSLGLGDVIYFEMHKIPL